MLGAGVAVVAVVAVFAVLAIVKNNGIGSVPTGPGTATITWHSAGGGVNSLPQPFSGTVAGLSLSGTATGANPSNVTNTTATPGAPVTFPSHLHVATWTGTLGGTQFDLDVSLSIGRGASAPAATTPGSAPGITATFLVTGSFGTQPVHVTATIDPQHPDELAFSGTVGNLNVTGTVNELQEKGTTGTATASFNVTK